MEFQRHPHGRCNDALQKIHITKDPLVVTRRHTKVALEERVQAVQEELDATITTATVHLLNTDSRQQAL